MRPINEIIVHCTATRPEWWATRTLAQKIAEVRLWHTRDRGWKDIGYHYLIDRDGKIGTGRPVEQVGAHVAGRNTGTIGVSLFGGHGSATTDRFEDNFTPEQDAALRQLLTDLCERFPTITKISGHNQYAAKACPGFDVTEWLKGGPVRPADRPTQPREVYPVPRPVPVQDAVPARAPAASTGFLARLLSLFKGDA